MFKAMAEIRTFIREQDVKMIDYKFTDLWGRWHHVTFPAHRLDERLIEEGVAFDGSSVGFKTVEAGDMVLRPDLSTGFLDPFWEETTLSFIAFACEANNRRPYPYDPRTLAQRAEAWLQESGIGTESRWGPEFEFYVFEHVSYENGRGVAAYRTTSQEALPRAAAPGDGYAIPPHDGYHAHPPRDRLHNLRSRISLRLEAAGVPVKYHHHEVGSAGQCEIETPLLPLLRAADAVQIVKYITRMTAVEMGMTATFMPKPLYGEAGSGMHFHQHLWRDGVNLFYDAQGYGSLSEIGRWYIGGLLQHGGAVMAFTNPSTNAYRRLVPGYEAPISAIYALGNRSAAVRIPRYANQPHTARIEFRPPDATGNPYLAIAAQLLAGLDGIRRRLDPTRLGFGPFEEDIFTWSAEKRAQIKALPTSLEEALQALETDHDFLLVGEVFNEALIERWIEGKRREARAVRGRPHPYEFTLYYDL